MQPLSPPALLRVWEEGRARSLVERALLLLEGACPDEPVETLAALHVGQRDARILTLREWTFGSAIEAVTRCPACGVRSELRFDVPDARVPVEADAGAEHALELGAYHVVFRVPDSRDLTAANGLAPATARRRLLERCILAARRSGASCPWHRLPARVVSAVLERMAQLAAQADLHAALKCPACAHDSEAIFDIVSFFWAELDAWAHRTLHDVHVLASAYAWSEADILALPPLRRQYYLELVHQ